MIFEVRFKAIKLHLISLISAIFAITLNQNKLMYVDIRNLCYKAEGL